MQELLKIGGSLVSMMVDMKLLVVKRSALKQRDMMQCF